MREVMRERRAAAPKRPPQTHCKRGHEFDEANTYLLDGRRTCRACKAARMRRIRNGLVAT
jgi:hypothetical protein